MKLPPLKELFPFDYQGGGYFRLRGAPKGAPAMIIHGPEAIKLLYDSISRLVESPEKVTKDKLEQIFNSLEK